MFQNNKQRRRNNKQNNLKNKVIVQIFQVNLKLLKFQTLKLKMMMQKRILRSCTKLVINLFKLRKQTKLIQLIKGY